MTTRTRHILNVMKALTWVVFIGLCIKAGAILISYIVSVFVNSQGASDLYLGLDLSDLKTYNVAIYSILVLFVILLYALKAYMFYCVINIFSKINYENPFSEVIGSLIRRISYLAFGIGLLALLGMKYGEWLVNKGVNLSDLPSYLYGGAEFIFFAGILYIISLVFKTGIENQVELDETV